MKLRAFDGREYKDLYINPWMVSYLHGNLLGFEFGRNITTFLLDDNSKQIVINWIEGDVNESILQEE